MRPGTVWIAEDFDDEEFGFLTGLFSAHWEGPGDQREQGPRSVPVEEALAWGRARADVVLIRSGESDYFSAGVGQPEGEELPGWPADARFSRRRAPSAAYLDRTSADDPILWQVTLQASLAVSELGGFPVTFNQAVAADVRVIDPLPYSDPTPADADITDYSHLAADTKIVSARFKLSARTWEEAEEVGSQIGSAAFTAALPALGAGDWAVSFSVSAVPAEEG